MIKKAILKLKATRNEKRRVSDPASDFRGSRKIGLLYDHSYELSGDTTTLVDAFKYAGKEVSTLGFCLNKAKITSQRSFFDPGDISLFGDLTTDHLNFFIDQTYDFFICLDSTSHFTVDYLLSLAKSPCRVGLLNENRSDLLDFMIKVGSDRNEPAVEILKYLKMIHHDA